MKKVLLGCFCVMWMLSSLWAELPEQNQNTQENAEQSEQIQSKKSPTKNKFFVGASVAASMLETSSEYYNAAGAEIEYIDGDRDMSGVGASVRIGYDVYFRPEQAIRIYADYLGTSFSKSEILGRANFQHVGANVDYRYDFINGFGIFGGAGVVYSSASFDIGNLNHVGGALNMGVAYALTDYLEIELRAKLFFTEYYKNKSISPIVGTSDINAVRQQFDMEAPMNLMLGLNARF